MQKPVNSNKMTAAQAYNKRKVTILSSSISVNSKENSSPDQSSESDC